MTEDEAVEQASYELSVMSAYLFGGEKGVDPEDLGRMLGTVMKWLANSPEGLLVLKEEEDVQKTLELVKPILLKLQEEFPKVSPEVRGRCLGMITTWVVRSPASVLAIGKFRTQPFGEA